MRNWPNEISVLGNSFEKTNWFYYLLSEWECFDSVFFKSISLPWSSLCAVTHSSLSITEAPATANQSLPASLHLLPPTGQGTGSICLDLHLETKKHTICLSEKFTDSTTQIPNSYKISKAALKTMFSLVSDFDYKYQVWSTLQFLWPITI